MKNQMYILAGIYVLCSLLICLCLLSNNRNYASPGGQEEVYRLNKTILQLTADKSFSDSVHRQDAFNLQRCYDTVVYRK